MAMNPAWVGHLSPRLSRALQQMYSTAGTTDIAQSISAKPRHIAGRRIGSCFSHTPPQHTLFHSNVPKEDHIEFSLTDVQRLLKNAARFPTIQEVPLADSHLEELRRRIP